MPFNISFSQTKTPDAVRKHYIFALTPIGKQKIREYEGEGVKFNVMTVLAQRGPCNVDEVAEGANITKDKAMFVLKDLVKAQYVHTVGAGGGE